MSEVREVLFVIDPPERFDPRTDSTVVMIEEALRRGWRPFGALMADLSLHGAEARARVRALSRTDAGPVAWGSAAVDRPLASFRAVVMRKDPPVDAAYLTATWILDHASTLVVNAPAGLRNLNEKLGIAMFPDLSPRTYVSRSAAELRTILDTLGGTMIVKPVYGFGGREILIARRDDPNLGSLLEIATAEGRRWTVAQEYLPAAHAGDKRILLVDGEVIGAVLRVPAAGELRNNFHTGGTPHVTELDDQDIAICSHVGPVLARSGHFLVGLDVIGGRLTEINVTSPTGMQEINRLQGCQGDDTMQALMWDRLERKLGAA